MIKEKLENYLAAKREMMYILEQINELNDSMRFPKTQQYTGMPMHHDFDADGIGKIVIRLEALKENYKKQLDVVSAICIEVEQMMGPLTLSERNLIRMKYFKGMSNKDIAAKLGFSVRHVRRLLHAIIEKLENI